MFFQQFPEQSKKTFSLKKGLAWNNYTSIRAVDINACD